MRTNILPRNHFLNLLRVEKRRADRSKTPLSIVLFYLNGKEVKDARAFQHFFELIHQNTRETDIKGWVDHHTLGLLLPDTSEDGAGQCIKKITEKNGDAFYSVLAKSYPDHLFEQLLHNRGSAPDLFPLNLDDPPPSKRFQRVAKRMMDIVGSIAGLIMLSPIMLLTAMAIKVTSPGPVIFKQFRFGMKGTYFSFYKFRSMRSDVDERVHREYVAKLIKGELDKINQGDREKPFYKIKNDERVTRVGKLIRKTSIDELPQFFNVLKGEMSLVGPRPPIPYEVEKYKPWHLRRILEVKPGITGLWQVEGRSKTSFDDMVRLDLNYALNWSVWHDLWILLKTVKAVIRRHGAV